MESIFIFYFIYFFFLIIVLNLIIVVSYAYILNMSVTPLVICYFDLYMFNKMYFDLFKTFQALYILYTLL